MKELVAEPKPVDRADEILRAVAKLQTLQAPYVAFCGSNNTTPNRRENTLELDDRMLDRSEITQIIRQEFRRANGKQQNRENQNRNIQCINVRLMW